MKGRNPRLIQLRNEFLIKRYYYWFDIVRLRRDDVYQVLSEQEVFIEQDYIRRLIRDNTDLLKQLRKNGVTEKQLKEFSFDYLPQPKYVAIPLFN